MDRTSTPDLPEAVAVAFYPILADVGSKVLGAVDAAAFLAAAACKEAVTIYRGARCDIRAGSCYGQLLKCVVVVLPSNNKRRGVHRSRVLSQTGCSRQGLTSLEGWVGSGRSGWQEMCQCYSVYIQVKGRSGYKSNETLTFIGSTPCRLFSGAAGKTGRPWHEL